MRTPPPPNNTGPKARMTSERIALMLNELVAGPSTQAELSAVTGLATETVSDYLDQLNSARDGRARLVRICRWDPDRRGRRTVAVWEWNPGGPPNAVRVRVSTAERTRAYKERCKATAVQRALAQVSELPE